MDIKTRRSCVVAVVLGAVAGFAFLFSGQVADVADQEVAGELAARRSADPMVQLGERPGSSQIARGTGRTTVAQTIVGRLVWSDGTVVTGGLVRFGAQQVEADAAGVFAVTGVSAVDGAAAGLSPVALAVKALCWSNWSDVTAAGHLSDTTSRVEIGDVVLENEIDLAADLTWSSEFAEILAASGVEAIGLQIKTAAVDRPGGAKVGGDDAPIHDLKLHLDSRIRGSEVAALQMRLRVPSRPQAVPAEKVALYRTTTNHWVRSLGVEDLVRGRIVDHLGADLPEASLDMSVHGTHVVQAPLFLPVHVSENGHFVAYLDRRYGATIRASCHGTKGAPMEVASGPVDVAVSVDMSAHALLRLRRGPDPVPVFSISDQSILFGRREVPRLMRHERGYCWLPKWKFPVHAFVAWREAEVPWEELVEIPVPDAQGAIAMDLDSLVPQILGTVLVQNSGRGCSVTLTRVEPAPPSPRYRLTTTFNNQHDATITGVPPGRYEVDIMTGGFRTDAERHFRSSVVFGGEHDKIAIEDIVAAGK